MTDAGTGNPVSGAQVFVEGTQFGTLTNRDGTYRLEGVPTGEHTIRVSLIGYRKASRTVTVAAGQAATADFQLTQTALKLQEVVVTGVAGETPQVKLPFSVNQVNTADAPVPSSSVGGLLQGKVAGASIMQASGQPGEGFDIQLRGATSLNAAGRGQEPLIVVDGTILGRGMGMADLSSLDIKNIEVVKGAAAASLYGSRAANGVVKITTQRGESVDRGNVDLTLRAEAGEGELPRRIDLANSTALRTNPEGCPDSCYLDASGNPTTYGSAALDVEEGYPAGANSLWKSFMDNPYPEEQLYDQLDRFFRGGSDRTLYAAASGNFGNTNFRVSGEYYDERGIIRFEDGYQRKNVRVNLDNSPTENLDFQVSGFFSDATQDLTNQGSGGPFFALTFMPPNLDLMREDDEGDLIIAPDPRYSNLENPLYDPANEVDNNLRQRLMGSFQATWDPTAWLTLESNLSYDRSGVTFRFFQHRDFKTTEEPGGTGGQMQMNQDFQEALNAKFLATYHNTFGDLTTRTRAQVLVERQHDEGFQASNEDFAVANTPTLGALTGDADVDSYERSIRSESYYLISNLDYKGRYILDGLVRRDGSSLFGSDRRWHTYYRGSAAWRVAQEPWWPGDGAVTQFKLRGSYGTAGSRPRFNAQYESYSITGAGGVVPQTLGNEELEPEFAQEMELGLDFTLFDRVSGTLTYAESDVDQQILNVPLPGYFGFSSQWRNAGSLHSETWEASLQSSVLQTEDASWTVNATFAATESRITDLGVAPYQWGPNNAFYNREGEVLGTMYGTRWAQGCDDLPRGTPCDQFDVNDDGLLVWVGEGNSWRDGIEKKLWGTTGTVNGETYQWGSPIVAVNDQGEDFLPLGNTSPDASVSLGNNLSWRGLQLYALFDAALGFTVYNQTIQWSFRDRRSGIIDQRGKPDAEKKPIQYYKELYHVNATNSFFAEDGSYVKLRELSLNYSFPGDLVRSAFGGFVDGATLSLTGRNLITWTDYRGYDPEVGQAGGQGGSASLTRFADFDYPNFRTVSGSVQLTF